MPVWSSPHRLPPSSDLALPEPSIPSPFHCLARPARTSRAAARLSVRYARTVEWHPRSNNLPGRSDVSRHRGYMGKDVKSARRVVQQACSYARSSVEPPADAFTARVMQRVRKDASRQKTAQTFPPLGCSHVRVCSVSKEMTERCVPLCPWSVCCCESVVWGNPGAVRVNACL